MEEQAHDIRKIVPGLVNACTPLERVLTAGQPDARHLEALAKAGYRTVLDLRAPDEPRPFDEAAEVRRLGMEYVNLPVTADTLGDETFDRFRALMRDPDRRPLLLHCASANRVGALLIPYLVLDEGRSPDEAVELAVQVGLRSEELRDAALDYVRRARAS